MPDTDSLSFRPLQADDVDLALGIVGVSTIDDPATESFGTNKLAAPLPSLGWGLWLQGILAGAAWMTISSGKAEVKAVAIPKGRRGLGLTGWILGELAAVAKSNGCGELMLSVENGGEKLGEILTDAGFVGPDLGSDAYPTGKWSKLCR